jgi:hypothetical protein
MKVDVSGLMSAARRLTEAAMLVQGTGPGELTPLAPDTTSAGAAARLQAAASELWGSACAQAASLASAAAHLILIAAKFATQEEANKFNIAGLQVMAAGLDTGSLTALEPVPPLAPDIRAPLPPLAANLNGEAFSEMVTVGSGDGAAFTTNATNNGTSADSVARTLRAVAASVPDMWDSPVGTAALSGRLIEYANAATAISDRWFQLGDETRKHADDHSRTVSAVPKPQEFKENEARLVEAQRQGNGIAASQLLFQRGELNQRAVAIAVRYAADTELTTSPKGAPVPEPAGGVPAGVGPAGAAAGAAQAAAGQPATALNKTSAGVGEAAQAGQAGDAAGQLAQLLPAALGAVGGMAGGAAGMAGQIPQALMQTGQGLAQAATQGMSGLTKSPADAELAKSTGAFNPEELSKAEAGGGAAGGGGGGATHPAGALGPPVTPSTSHTPPTMPAGSSAAPGPTPTGASAMGAMPMGMPMGGMMPHGAHGGEGAGARVAADKKIVVPPQPHTEPVTGKVSDRTAAAAEAARARAESDDPDEPPRGPVMRRITLASLGDGNP